MDSDTPPVVNLEVTVPRILLSTTRTHPGQMESLATKRQGEGSEDEDVEQVRLLPVGLQQNTLPYYHKEQHPGDVPMRMIHAIRFRLFRITLPAQGQPFLLQVLRRDGRYSRYDGEKQQDPKNEKVNKAYTEQPHLTGVATFSVKFRHLDKSVETATAATTPTSSPDSTSASTLIPGLNEVIIYLDDEGTPGNYSIDGAES